MTEKMVCPICGEPTSSYMGHYRKDRLCKKHATALKTAKSYNVQNAASGTIQITHVFATLNVFQNYRPKVLIRVFHAVLKLTAMLFVLNVSSNIQKTNCLTF